MPAFSLREIIRSALPRSDWMDFLIGQYFYYGAHGRLARPRNPRSFNDHYFRIKMTEGRHPLRVFVTDKEFVKWYVASKVGPSLCVPTYAVLRTEEEIDRLDWPARCVIKPTHSCHDVIVRRGPEEAIDIPLIKGWLAKDYYLTAREVNYKHLERKVIDEPFLDFGQGGSPVDVKVYCFFGEPKIVQVDTDSLTALKRVWYTTDWRKFPVTLRRPMGPDRAPPRNLEKLIELARTLAEPFSSIRVDFYTDEKEEIRVGELTNVTANALGRFIPDPSFDTKLAPLFEDPAFDPRSVL